MTVGIVLVVVAVLALVFLFGVTVSRSRQLSRVTPASRLQPIDIAAFRNLVDPAEDEYLRRRLPSAEFRAVQRKRLRATAAYIHAAARNAALLVQIGQTALTARDPSTVAAARQLVDNALLLRRNATFALFRIYGAMAWPNSGLAAERVLHGYERLSGAAMLLGRLQNPAVPLRISPTL
jgi:hypothetical protein